MALCGKTADEPVEAPVVTQKHGRWANTLVSGLHNTQKNFAIQTRGERRGVLLLAATAGMGGGQGLTMLATMQPMLHISRE